MNKMFSARAGRGRPGAAKKRFLINLMLASFTTLHAADAAAQLTPAQPPKLVPANWNPKAAADKVIAGLIKVTAPEVKGAHGSKLTLIGDRAYVATLADNTAPGETHERDSIYSALSVVNLQTKTVEAFLTTAKSGQAFANETLPRGACYASGTLQLNDHTLRCFFCSEQPGRGQSQMYYRDFDLRTRAFTNDVHRVKLKTSSGVFDLQPQYLHADAVKHGFTKPAKDYSLELLDAFKKFDGRTYAVLNSYVNALNALTVFNEAGDTLEVVGHYNEPQSQRLCESAVNRLPDGTWMAICRSDVGNYHFTTSKDGKTWSVGQERPIVPNGVNSKPTFDTFGGVYYLGWQEKTMIQGVYRSVFNVDVSKDCVTWERKYRFESADSFQYPAFAEHDGAVWLTVSQGGRAGPTRIMFGKLEDLPKPAVKVTQELLNSTRVGTGRELWNNNSAELAVIPDASLSVAAEASTGASLESRGLPRILFNNDSDDLKWPAYPEHHANGLWVPAGKYLP
ncbi:MAG: sialidase family protein, partial [Kiritimatiellia bacterium]